MRSLEKQVIQSHQQKLQQYEEVFTRAIHQQYPLGDEARHQLQRLQQSLGLGEKIIKSIEAQVTQAYEQKLLQYHEVFTQAIQQQYPLSNDDDRFLEDFRQVVNLSQKQVDQADEQRLQQYEAAFTRVIHQQYPVSDESRRLLNQLQHNLELRNTAVESIEAQVTQTYEQKLLQYQEVFTRAIQRQYPLSDSDDRFLANLRRAFNLNPKITDSIETLENLRRVLNLNETVTDSIEARAIQTYTSNLSLPINRLQGGKYQQKVRQLLVKAIVVAVALTSMSLVARAAYIQWWQANQVEKIVLGVAETLKAEKKYEACTNQAREIPQRSRLYPEAQTLLNQCRHLAQDEQQLVQAKAFATKNNFKDAIVQAGKIQLNSSLHQEAQQLISQWSKPLKQAEAQSQQSSSSTQTLLKQEKESETVTKANQARLPRQEIKPSIPYRQNTTKLTTATADEPVATRNSQESETTERSGPRQSSIQRSYTRRSSAQQFTTQRSTTRQPSSAKQSFARRSAARQSAARRSATQQSATRRSATRQSDTQQSTPQRSSSGGWIADQE